MDKTLNNISEVSKIINMLEDEELLSLIYSEPRLKKMHLKGIKEYNNLDYPILVRVVISTLIIGLMVRYLEGKYGIN